MGSESKRLPNGDDTSGSQVHEVQLGTIAISIGFVIEYIRFGQWNMLIKIQFVFIEAIDKFVTFCEIREIIICFAGSAEIA